MAAFAGLVSVIAGFFVWGIYSLIAGEIEYQNSRNEFLNSRIAALDKEIAEIMDISTKTVENQIGIALKFLKENTSRNAHS